MKIRIMPGEVKSFLLCSCMNTLLDVEDAASQYLQWLLPKNA